MRLTLRTMLGFMDNVLEPKDAQEIGQKIEESEFARGLLSRMRDLMRRVRLSAPDPQERGQGLDANSVAEYLDNTLPGDRVADFEKVCLESDVHLAEVASAHQILALVLGEPAEIEDRSRQRMYQLPSVAEKSSDVEAVAIATVGAPRAPAKEEKEEKGERHKPSVPQYLREAPPPVVLPTTSSLLPVFAAVLLGIVVITLVLGAFGQFEPGTPLGNLVRGLSGSAEVAENTEEPTAPSEPAPNAKGPGDAAQTPSGADKAAANAGDKAKSVSADGKPAAVPAPTASGKQDRPAASPATADAKPAGSAPPNVPPAGNAPANATVPAKPPVGAAGSATAPKSEPPTPAPAKSAPLQVVPAKPPATAVAVSEQVGRLTSEKQILLENDPTAGWRRIPAQGAVKTSIALLALPAFQPVMALRVPLTVQMLAGTELEFLPADAQGVPGINVHYGRVIIRAVGPQSQLRVEIGRQQGVLTIQSTDAVAALMVGRARAWGTDPERDPGAWRGDLFGVSGKLAWSEGGAAPQTLPASHQWQIGAPLGQAQLAQVELPAWMPNGDEAAPLDKWATNRLEQEIKPDRSVQLSLREQLAVSQREVVWLAIRSLGYVGEFDPLAAIFHTSDQRSAWDEFQSALARGPEVAAHVRQGFEKQYPADAAALYRLLWGYSEKAVIAGAATTLVNYLDSDEMAFRVLAFWNLEKVAGAKFGYKPSDTGNKRLPFLNRWRDWRDKVNAGQAIPKPAGAAPAGAPKR